MTAVFVETNRPDLISETAQAVYSSTLKMHGMDFFRKDVVPAQIIFDAPGYLQTLDTVALSRFRAMSWLRKDAPAIYAGYETSGGLLPPMFSGVNGSLLPAGLARALLTEIDADDFLDEFGSEKIDVWYQAGDTIFIRSSTLLQFGLMGYYTWPNLDITNANLSTWTVSPLLSSPLFHSWIARDYPYTIIYDAASALLQKIGMADAARKYDAGDAEHPQGLVWSHIRNLIISNTVGTGY